MVMRSTFSLATFFLGSFAILGYAGVNEASFPAVCVMLFLLMALLMSGRLLVPPQMPDG